MGVAAGCCTGTGVGTTGGLAVAALSIGLSVPDAGPADGVVAGASSVPVACSPVTAPASPDVAGCTAC